MDVIRKLSLLFIFLCISQAVFATHNRAGEITYEQIGPLTIRATITTYTKASSTSADRDSLELFWGDGTSTLVERSNGNGQGVLLPGEDIKINLYIAEHTYPGRATYKLSFTDPNRVNNIQNINFPNSVDVQFYVETTFTFTNTQFQGFNSSVRLLQPPIDFACVNERFVHNPNAYDPDGDSLSFSLIVPLESEGREVPKYELPNEAALPGPDNNISLDPVTGEFVWDTPKAPGEYNIAIRINEYRNGVLLNSVIRDMQIFVDACTTRAPVIDVVEEICVVAGEYIDIPVLVDDPDEGELVRISATGGPFLLNNSPARIINDTVYTEPVLETRFRWQTNCDHISNSYYQVVFRAQDNSRSTTGLAILKTLRIKVVGPPPDDIDGMTVGDSIMVSWDFDYRCKETTDDYFIGFSVWRKTNPNPFIIDSCETGLAGKGYEIVKFLTQENDGGRYFFYDDRNLEKGRIYCYRVLANFARKTPGGNPFNITESLTSDEICLQLSQDIPLITKVSIHHTDIESGEVLVEWIKPLPGDLDTIKNPGPYRYVLKRSTDGVIFQAVPGADFSASSFASSIQLSFLDTSLNTASMRYFYEVDFYTGSGFYDTSIPASSVFVNVASSDNENEITWDEEVPWENFSYDIFKDSGSGYEFLENVDNSPYVDYEVSNDREYCYFVQSRGTYGLSTTPPLLLNFSQRICGTPLDTVGPCAPVLTVDNPCDILGEELNPAELVNSLQWPSVIGTCNNSRDLASYNIYYTNNVNADLQLIDNIDDSAINTFQHAPLEGINGCYAVSGVDSLGNEGPISNLVCVENCPIYTLPNTFTPNGDGANDRFTPIENRFVHSVDFKVVNRWGNLVYQTADPALNWDGTTLDGESAEDGTYYYICRVFEQNNDGIVRQSKLLNGYIEILR